MSVERIFYCDAPECDAHTRTIAEHPGMGFLMVDDGESPPLCFCSWDCVLRFGAKQPPIEVIDG